jgi:hypothetical protein
MRFSDWTNKKWFSWILLAVLLISNVISYRIANSYFSKITPNDSDEVRVESSMLGSGAQVIDWAREVLRFFRNP